MIKQVEEKEAKAEGDKARDNGKKRSRVVSAGFIVRSQGGKYLMGKTTKFPKKRCWTVFKGQQEEGESIIATATRELKEEAGINILRSKNLQLSQSTTPFYSFSMKEKLVYLYLLDDTNGELNDAEFSCNSYWGKDRLPEICEHQWMTLDEMDKVIFPSQRGMVAFLRGSELESNVISD
jgi:8-oxo-dGTP pyrophosphatase MutT (NUDIX family)